MAPPGPRPQQNEGVEKRVSYKSSGQGGVEEQTQEAQQMAKRVVEYKLQQERYKQEENFDLIQEQLDSGEITEVDARKLVARAKMHEEKPEQRKSAAMAGADHMTAIMILESHLDKERTDSGAVTVWLLKRFGLYGLHVRAEKERRRRKDQDFVHPYPRLDRAIKSTTFDVIVGVLMLANALTIGMQASAGDDDEDMAANYDILENLFTFLFTFEVALRMTADGWVWIWDRGNMSDTILVVFTGVLPMWILKPLGVNAKFVRGFGVLRVLRLVRLVRMVRTFRFFRLFWSLVQGVLDSGRMLLHADLIITVVLYMFGIFAVNAIARHPDLEGDSDALKYFGDLPRAMFTLFQVITLDRWFEVARPLMKKSSVVAPLLIVVIMVVTLALLNLIMAIIVNNAFERTRQDEEARAEMKKKEMETQIEELMYLFMEMDEDQSGMLSKEEYDNALLENEDVTEKFQILDISSTEYQDIWKILDEGSGEVSMDRFAEVVRSMKGEAKAKDSFSILRRVHRANEQMARINQRLGEHRLAATELRHEATQVRQQLGNLQRDMCSFISLLGKCVPTKPIEIQATELEQWADQLHEEVGHML